MKQIWTRDPSFVIASFQSFLSDIFFLAHHEMWELGTMLHICICVAWLCFIYESTKIFTLPQTKGWGTISLSVEDKNLK